MKPKLPASLVALITLMLLSTLNFQLSTAFAQGTAFTYQGHLSDGSTLANGSYDLRFVLFDDRTSGTQQGPALTNSAVTISNGLFTATLDFGASFPGADRWLEIGVRPNGGSNFTTLTPRQPLTATPYAITASNLSGTLQANQLSGVYSNAVTLNNAANNFSGRFIGDGGALSNVSAATLGGLSANKFWQLGGNAGTAPGSNFIGTTDGQPLLIRADGGVGIGTLSPLTPLHVVSSNNSVPQLQLTQSITNNFARLRMNVAGSPFWEMDVSSGAAPSLSFWNSTLRMLIDYTGNVSAASFSGDGSGLFGLNAANVSAGTLVDTRLSANVALRSGGNVFSGSQVISSGVLGIGAFSPIIPLYVASSNSTPQVQITQNITNDFTRLRMNVSGSPFWEMDVSSGAAPSLSFWNSTLRMFIDYTGNVSAASFGYGAGGPTALHYVDSADVNKWKLRQGGADRIAVTTGGNVGIGTMNPASPLHVASAGNTPQFLITQNTTNDFTRLRMNVSGSPFWEMDVSSGGTPSLSFWNSTLRMLMDYNGNLGVGTGNPDSRLHVVSGGTAPQLHLNQTTSGDFARLNLTVNDGNLWSIAVTDTGSSTPGNLEFRTESGAPKMRIDRAGNVYSIGGFNGSSDRNAKENFEPVNARDVLNKVASLPLTKWNYKQDSATKHLGPMAQDFYAAFGVGPDDKHIATVDADGVALAAIQGLNQKLEQQRAENAELKHELAELKKLVQQITCSMR